MSEENSIRVDYEGECMVITASGILDLTNSAAFRDNLRRGAEKAENVRVDFVHALFIDTAVIHYLAVAAKTLMERDRRMKVIVRRGSHPDRVLSIVGFGVLMDIEVREP